MIRSSTVASADEWNAKATWTPAAGDDEAQCHAQPVPHPDSAAEASACFHRFGFDFAVAEECWQNGDCEQYSAEYGERVFDVEYDAAPSRQAAARARRRCPS